MDSIRSLGPTRRGLTRVRTATRFTGGTEPGRRLFTANTAGSTSRCTIRSSTRRWNRGDGRREAGSSVRSWRITSAVGVCGSHQTLTNSALAPIEPSRLATAATGTSSIVSASRNAGTTRRVSSVTTPSAPRCTRTASSRGSPVARSSTVPAPVTSRAPSIRLDRFPCTRLEPCVPVPTAPATDCCAIDPRIGSASPRRASSALRSHNRVPARTVTVPSPVAVTPDQRSSDIAVSSGAAIALNEWPAPTTRTRPPAVAAERTTSAIASASPGSCHTRGADVTVRDQLVNPPRRSRGMLNQDRRTARL